MQRRTIAKIALLAVVFGFFIAFAGVYNIAYAISYSLIPHNAALDVALGQLARAESAQTSDEVIHHLTVAKAVLPERGSVFWWSPEKANFESIHGELDDIISRARNISSLDAGNEVFKSEMWDIHARLEDIQETLIPF